MEKSRKNKMSEVAELLESSVTTNSGIELIELEEVEAGASYVYTAYDKKCEEDLLERKLYINYEINEDIIPEAVYHILKWNKEDKGIPVEDRTPIKIYMSTPGGSLQDGMELVDVIVASKTPVYSINLGYQYSMGFFINLVASKRYASINATYLMHDGFSFVCDSVSKTFDTVEFKKCQEERLKKIVLSRTKITSELYEEKRRKEWYTFAEEAKEYGFCDYILGIDCDIDEII